MVSYGYLVPRFAQLRETLSVTKDLYNIVQTVATPQEDFPDSLIHFIQRRVAITKNLNARQASHALR